MKISIWQQFSSNHSAHFIVVGEFETVQRATEVTQELRDMLDQLQKWWDEESPTTTEGIDKFDETEELTPIEKQLRDQYQVDWAFSLNWFFWAWDRNISPVQQYDRHVVVENPNLIRKGPQPFAELMGKLGGQVFLEVSESRSYPNHELFLDITCTLPDNDEDAQTIYNWIREDFEWYRQLEKDWDHELNVLPELTDHLYDARFEPEVRLYEIEREGQMLKLYGVSLACYWSWHKNFPEFLDQLKNFGLTDIQYTFHSSQVFFEGR